MASQADTRPGLIPTRARLQNSFAIQYACFVLLLEAPAFVFFVVSMSLPSLQEVSAHARRFNWDVRSFYGYIWQLSGAQISTKETLEDCLGDLTDIYSRDKKGGSKQMAPERVFLHYTMSERLSTQYVQLEEGDFRNAGSRNFGSDRAAVFGEKMKESCSTCKMVADMKKACQEGLVFRSGFQSLYTVFSFVVTFAYVLILTPNL